MNFIQKVLSKTVLPMLIDKDIFHTLAKLLKDEKITKEQGEEFTETYLANGYKKNRMQAILLLSNTAGFGNSISDLAKFSEYMKQADEEAKNKKI